MIFKKQMAQAAQLQQNKNTLKVWLTIMMTVALFVISQKNLSHMDLLNTKLFQLPSRQNIKRNMLMAQNSSQNWK